jgi:hypothetical protein
MPLEPPSGSRTGPESQCGQGRVREGCRIGEGQHGTTSGIFPLLFPLLCSSNAGVKPLGKGEEVGRLGGLEEEKAPEQSEKGICSMTSIAEKLRCELIKKIIL